MTKFTIETDAVAGEMLGALKALREWASITGDWDAPCWEWAAVAIAKAEAAGVVASPPPELPQPDYEQAARAAGWVRDGDNCGFIFHKPTWGHWKAAQSWAGTDQEPTGKGDRPAVYDDWRTCCEDEDIAA